MDDIEREIELLKLRNERVEMEKDWETCPTRIITVCVITYVATAALFAFIGVRFPFLNALIPTSAFLVSTLSLPPIRKRWNARHLKKRLAK